MTHTDYTEKKIPLENISADSAYEEAIVGSDINITAGSQHLHRKLRGKEVQLFAIGGVMGTCECLELVHNSTQLL